MSRKANDTQEYCAEIVFEWLLKNLNF